MEYSIENLKNNFLFQASLGSKELFHSNMLAWLLEQKNKEGEYEVLKMFMKDVLSIEIPLIRNEQEIRIAREEKNIDLIVKWKEGDDFNYAFIENKIKSIPTPEQLVKYDKTIESYKGVVRLDIEGKVNKLTRKIAQDGNARFLLTPFRSNLTLDKWQNISYAERIIPFLKKIKDFEFAYAEQTNIKMVIEKYISFLEDQNEIIRSLNLDNLKEFKNRQYDFYSKHTLDNEEESEKVSEDGEEGDAHYMTKVRSLRLHDLVLKMAHSNLSNLLDHAFKNNIHIKETYKCHDNFTNSSGLSAVSTRLYEIINKKDKRKNKYIDIGVQLQGNQFRYYLSSNDKDLNIKLAEKLLVDGIWFYDVNTKKTLLGKGRSGRIVKDSEGESRTFCEYSSGGFLYFYADVYQDDKIPSIKEIIEKFIFTFKHYESKKTQIVGILDKFLKP